MQLGIQVAVALWAMTGLSLALVVLRLYTRIRIVKFVGTEDYLFATTGLFLLVFAATLHVSVHYGLGRSLWGLSLDDSSNAIFWSFVANTFAVTGNAMAKLSMGFFLLRVVQLRGQKVVLWVLIIVTAGTSIALVIMLWNQTTPRKMSWDPLRTHGTWNIQIQPMSVGLGAWSSACDFFFAIFPWMFIWSLRMPRREKIMLAGGMSLGVIAGACGIVRTVVLSRLDVMDYTLNFAPYYIWAGAEIAVAMVCLGIPTLRPLYLRNRGISVAYTEGALTNHDIGSDPELPRFTMLDQKAPPSPQTPQQPQHISRPPSPQPTGEKGKLGPHHIRDSSSSHTMVESAPSPEPKFPLYTTAGTIIRPPSSAHTKRSRSDSVDDILGLYDERSRSRGRSRASGRTTPGVVNSTNDATCFIATAKDTINYNDYYDDNHDGNRRKPLTGEGIIWARSDIDVQVTDHHHDVDDHARMDVEMGLHKSDVDNWPLRS
ncbi:hypothetical protein B0H66DRAFT_347873 [Apodospora peruviana]|uniref:Rhodopsin domain-containing protein n=1 Tax=Apodospora peruviana TaxID=516989 RepID=A0AAE0HZB8_9PEZI|nr:hypothetical protein B0H66DRAFT_347873 [Apodospora peruviana]